MKNYKITQHSQKGFTLVELMVGVAIALVVLTGAGGLLVSTLISNSNKIIGQRVDQNMRVLTAYMTDEIRRAGYADNTTNGTGVLLDTLTISADKTCITFSHAKPMLTTKGGVITVTYPETFYGFRLANNAVYIRKNDSAITCNIPINTAGAWTVITAVARQVNAVVKVRNS